MVFFWLASIVDALRLPGRCNCAGRFSLILVASFRYALYTYLGSDGPDVVDTGRPQNNVFDSNTILGGPQAIKLKEADGTKITNNYFEEPTKIEFNLTTGTYFTGNTGLEDAEVKATDSCFAESDVEELSESC